MRALAAGLALTEAAHTPALSVLVAGRVTRGQALAVLQVGARSGPIREALVVREMELPVGIPGLIRVHLVLVPRTVVMAAVALIVAVQIVSIRVALAVREMELPAGMPKVAHTVVHEVVTIHRRHVHHGRQINPDLVQPRLDGMPKEDFLRPELRVLPFLKMRRWKNWIDRRKTSCAHWMKFNARMLLVTL